MAHLDNIESKEMDELFASAQDLVEWSGAIVGRDDLKKYVILHCLGDSIFSQRLCCTKIYNLSERKDDFDIFAEEILTNGDLTDDKIRQMQTLFIEYLDSQSCDRDGHSSASSIPPCPILKKHIELRFVNIEGRSGDGIGDGRKYVLGRKMSGGYGLISEVKSLEDLSCDF